MRRSLLAVMVLGILVSIPGLVFLGGNILVKAQQENQQPLQQQQGSLQNLQPAVSTPGVKKKESGKVEFNKIARFGKPITVRNLTIYPILGKDRAPMADFMLLGEAMEKKLITVVETGNVNQLVIKSTAKVPVYIHAGDVVRGGKQDRMLSDDCIIPPGSKKVSISSFCVESGRWAQRGGASVGYFSGGSMNNAIGNRMRAAGQIMKSQAATWSNVQSLQGKLAGNASSAVIDSRSRTSLELTLSHPELKKATQLYNEAIKELAASSPEAIGYALAINGNCYSVEVYGSHALFAQLWKKLAPAVAKIALAEAPRDTKARFHVTAPAEFVKKIDSSPGETVQITEQPGDVAVKVWELKNYAHIRALDKQEKTLHESFLWLPEQSQTPAIPTGNQFRSNSINLQPNRRLQNNDN